MSVKKERKDRKNKEELNHEWICFRRVIAPAVRVVKSCNRSDSAHCIQLFSKRIFALPLSAEGAAEQGREDKIGDLEGVPE